MSEQETNGLKELLRRKLPRPDHYNMATNPIDLIKAMEASGSPLVDFARANIIKYAFRTKGDRKGDLLKIIDYAEIAIKEVEAGSVADSEGWISVKDDKPDADWCGLVTCDDGDVYAASFDGETFFHNNTEFRCSPVTHWRDLPPPAKG